MRPRRRCRSFALYTCFPRGAGYRRRVHLNTESWRWAGAKAEGLKLPGGKRYLSSGPRRSRLKRPPDATPSQKSWCWRWVPATTPSPGLTTTAKREDCRITAGKGERRGRRRAWWSTPLLLLVCRRLRHARCCRRSSAVEMRRSSGEGAEEPIPQLLPGLAWPGRDPGVPGPAGQGVVWSGRGR